MATRDEVSHINAPPYTQKGSRQRKGSATYLKPEDGTHVVGRSLCARLVRVDRPLAARRLPVLLLLQRLLAGNLLPFSCCLAVIFDLYSIAKTVYQLNWERDAYVFSSLWSKVEGLCASERRTISSLVQAVQSPVTKHV